MRLVKFLRLPRADQMLLIRAMREVLITRIALSIFSFGRVERLSRRAHLNGHSPDRIAWAVSVASRFVPGATCLTQAVAGRLLLQRYGYDCQLRLGVAKREATLLDAHAWLESGGEIVIGKHGVDQFTPLLPAGSAG